MYKNGDEGILLEVDRGAKSKGGRKKRACLYGIVRKRDGTQVRVPQTHPNMLSREMAYTSATRAVRSLHLVGRVGDMAHFPRLSRRTVFAHI